MKLKVYHCNEWHNEYTEFYRKSQVDELIEKKDKAFKYAQAVILVDIEIIKKQKRKRCVAMARLCEEVDLFGGYTSNYWMRWRNKWLELAEKFK